MRVIVAMDELPFKHLSPPPLHDIRKRIAELKRIDLSSADIEFLKSRLKLLLRGFMFETPILEVGQILYRGVPYSEKPSYSSQVSYPPAHKVKTFQRVNRPNQSMFYCSISHAAPFFELGLKAGDHVAISKWSMRKRVMVSNVGYAASVYAGLTSARQEEPWWSESPHTRTPSNALVSEFFSQEFSRLVPPGEEHAYKLSIAIAEKLYADKLHTHLPNGELAHEQPQLPGILYPTIAMRANSDNLVLTPEFVDQSLKLESIEWIRVDSKEPDFKYQVTHLDFANTFDDEGKIEWKGRRGHWVLSPGQQIKISVESGRFIARDEKGNLIQLT